MALNLPALPPLPAYPNGSDATPDALLNWRELARLHTWHEELRQREAANAGQQALADAGLKTADAQQALADAQAALAVALETPPTINEGVPVSALLEIIKLLVAPRA